MRKFTNHKFLLTFACLIFFSSILLSIPRQVVRGQITNIWYVQDTIDPTLEEVRWTEDGAIGQPPTWIEDGSWSEFSKRESLVSTGDIFVSQYERFNWPLVKEMYGLQFATFGEFAQYLVNNPLYWVRDIWQTNVGWYGIESNTTGISYSFDDTSSEASVWTYYHITRIPEYFLGSERLSSWLAAFDLTPISLGNLKIYEFYEDASINGIHYDLRFKAPGNILVQHSDNYTLTIAVSPSDVGRKFNMQQVIDINMPANTEIKQMTPANLSLVRGNTASFVLSKDDSFPSSFTVVSGPPGKPFNQAVVEGVSVWLLTPGGWAAIASLTVLGVTVVRGRTIWRRSRLYHHMYNSMVTIYDLYSSDAFKFHQEMANLSSSVFKLLIEDKITDEQFERLLVRRDDLVKRVQNETLPRPPDNVKQ
jgi:hypothetical protein